MLSISHRNEDHREFFLDMMRESADIQKVVNTMKAEGRDMSRVRAIEEEVEKTYEGRHLVYL